MQISCCPWWAEHSLQMLLPELALLKRSLLPSQLQASCPACLAALVQEVPLQVPPQPLQRLAQALMLQEALLAAQTAQMPLQAAVPQVLPAPAQVLPPGQLPHVAAAELRAQHPRCRCLPACENTVKSLSWTTNHGRQLDCNS